jgi:hypothetical protein
MEGVPFYVVQIVVNTLLPWMLGTAAVAGVLSVTPFGKGVIDFLRSRRRDTETLDGVLQELGEMRGLMVEVAERMDSMERRLMQDRAPMLGTPREQAQSPVEPAVTPH